MLQLEFTQLSDRGRVREHNEDYLGYILPFTPVHARTHGWLFALADGVGGHAQGEVASRTAVETLLAGFREAAPGEPLGALLGRLVQLANTRVFETALAAGRSGAGMSTTLVACALRFDRAVVAHVGDSRCYLIRRGRATPLTRDHTVAGEQARLGLLSAKEAAEAPTRHVLSRSLGTELLVSVESSEHLLLPGDVLLLCSDGLHGAVSGAEMAHALGDNAELKSAAQKLLSLANQRDGGDNISIQLIRLRSVERVGTYRGLPYKLR
jgi:PPM family protein phosphatase